MKTKFVTGMGLVDIDINKKLFKKIKGNTMIFFSYLRLHTIARILRKVCNYRKKPNHILFYVQKFLSHQLIQTNNRY